MLLEWTKSDPYYARCKQLEKNNSNKVRKNTGYAGFIVAKSNELDLIIADGWVQGLEKNGKKRKSPNGYCFHAETAMLYELEQILAGDKLLLAEMYLTGSNTGEPYIYELPFYACLPCANAMLKILGTDSRIFLPGLWGWEAVTIQQAYNSAKFIRDSGVKASLFRADINNLSVNSELDSTQYSLD